MIACFNVTRGMEGCNAPENILTEITKAISTYCSY